MLVKRYAAAFVIRAGSRAEVRSWHGLRSVLQPDAGGQRPVIGADRRADDGVEHPGAAAGKDVMDGGDPTTSRPAGPRLVRPRATTLGPS